MSTRIKELLCSMLYPERLEKCRELLATELSLEEKAHVQYFAAHALRQLGQPAEALGMCEAALLVLTESEQRALLMIWQAMAYHDLGASEDVAHVLRKLESQSNLSESVRSHMLALQGFLLAFRLDPTGLDRLSEAENMLTRLDMLPSVSWVQRGMIMLALRLGRWEMAIEGSRRVADPQFVVGARLIEAEALIASGDSFAGLSALDKVMDSVSLPEDRARVHYVQGLANQVAGNLVPASAQLEEALDILDELPYRDLDLEAAIRRLRAKLRVSEEVA